MARHRRLVSFMVLLLLCACDPFHVEFADEEDARSYRARTLSEAASAPATLTVMTWNIKFAGARIDFFFDCFGDRVLMDRAEVEANLRGLANKIRRVDPDLLLLQEVDVNSKRSAFIDQVQWLLDHTDLNYGVYASQWRADFVPSDGLGAIDNGNAILSRYPLTHGRRIALPLRGDQDGLERYFYLRRNLLTAQVDMAAGQTVAVVATHTAAYSHDGTKQAHIKRFIEEARALQDTGAIVIAGGDLNTLPPGSQQLSDFPDSVCTEEYVADDYREETTYLLPLYADFEPAIAQQRYEQDNASYFTHTVDGRGFWNRTLDYLFTSHHFVPGSGLVHQDERSGGIATMPLSDHAPLTAELEL